MPGISTCLWFDREAEAAANFYVSIFPNSYIVATTHYVEGLPQPAGTVMTVRFVLDGSEFIALNGGPQFHFTPAISFVASCSTQAEIDALWAQLGAGGREDPCGWLSDRYGVTWQIVPRRLLQVFEVGDPVAAQRVALAMHTMRKLDLAALERAYAGG